MAVGRGREGVRDPAQTPPKQAQWAEPQILPDIQTAQMVLLESPDEGGVQISHLGPGCGVRKVFTHF